jgi:hypothetical protein
LVLLKRNALIIVTIFLITLLLIFYVIIKAASEAPATEWDRTYGAIWGVAAFSTSDGGYAIAGTTGDWLTEVPRLPGGSWTNSTFLLIKTDAVGEVQWMRNCTRGRMQSAVLTSDGGYAVVTWLDGSLTKIDSQGNVQWNKTYATFTNAYTSSVIQVIDGGFAIAGYGDHPLYGTTEARLVKTDSNGDLLWNKTYGGPNTGNFVRSIIQADDGGYALAGSKRGDMWLAKTDSNGNFQWEEMYGDGGENLEGCSSIVRTSDGGYLLAGYTASSGAGDEDCWVVKVNSQGNVQWEKAYGTSGRDRFTSATQARTGGYVLVGTTDILRDFAGVIIKLSSSGELEWEKSFAGDNTPESVTVASDGGYIFAGFKGDPNSRDSKVWKGDPNSRDSEVWAVKISPDSGAQETEHLYTMWIMVAVVIVVAGLGLGLLIYFKRRKHEAEHSLVKKS